MSDTPSDFTSTTPPQAHRAPAVSSHHGITLTDDYAWLRADNWQEVMRDPSVLDPEIRSYLDAENAFMKAGLADTQDLQDTLFKEMKARLKEDDRQVPTRHGPYEYFPRFVKGGQYAQMCRIKRGGNVDEPEILLDGNAEAKDKSYWHLGGSTHSLDHKLLAYATDDKGSELYTIRIRDAETGETLGDEIPDTRGDMVWARDGKTLIYVRVDDNHRPLYVYRHTIGTPVSSDVLIYEEKDIGFYVGLSATQSQKFICIEIHDHETSEVRTIDSDDPESEPRLIAARRKGHQYGVEHHSYYFIITTNSNDSEDFRIAAVPCHYAQEENWIEIVPHKPGRLIIETAVFGNFMTRLEREDGLPRIVITPLKETPVHEFDHNFADTENEHAIAFDEEAYALGMSAGLEFDTTNLRITYSSMTTPAETYDYDMATRERIAPQTPGRAKRPQPARLRHAPRVRAGRGWRNRSRHASVQKINAARRLSARAALRLRRLRHLDARRLRNSAPLARRSRVHLRHRPHSRRKRQGLPLVHERQNEVEGQHLHRLHCGWRVSCRARSHQTRPHRRARRVGRRHARWVQLPTWRLISSSASFAEVPFVDVLNTMLDKDLPLTPPEWPEWGNPLTSAEEFAWIKAYSPYDNVAAKAYPHILAVAGLTDPRVTYWEPAKWIAKLREHNTSSNLVLLKTNMGAGHGGSSGRFESLKDTALTYAFALKIAGKAGV